MKTFSPTVFLLTLCAASAAAQTPTCPLPLAQIEPDGRVSAGSKDAVKDAFHAGLPLRVGWSLDFDNDGKVDVAHWSDAGFLTEFEGEIFAQLDDIQRQTPRRGTASVTMPAKAQRWSGLVGTTGVLESHFDDGTQTQPARVRTQWCIDSRAACALPSWRLVYLHDTTGASLEGSRNELLDAVRRGYPIRFAWGASVGTGADARSVEHAAEPVFISIMKGTELFVQLPEHIAQASYHDPAKAAFDKPNVLWRGMMGTNGSFDAVMVDRASGAEVWRMPKCGACRSGHVLHGSRTRPSPCAALHL